MADYISDLKRHVTSPIKKFVDSNQKKIRKKAVKIIQVPQESSEEDELFGTGKLASPSGKHHALEDNVDASGYALDSIRHWDVTMPPIRKYKRAGKLVPSVKNTVGLGKLFSKKRRITIELYKKTTPQQQAFSAEHDRRVFSKLHPRASMVVDQETNEGDQDFPPLEDDDFLLFRILKPAKNQRKGDGHQSPNKGGLFDWDDDDNSHATMPNGALEAHFLTTYNVTDYGDGQNEVATRWKEHYRTRVSSMNVRFVEHKLVEVEYGVGDDVVVRNIGFGSAHDADTFLEVFSRMRRLQHERGSRMAAEHATVGMGSDHNQRNLDDATYDENDDDDDGDDGTRGPGWFGSGFFQRSPSIRSSKEVNLLVEIVSATNLPIADITTSDPYVVVEDARKEWHRTGVISKSLNPVWTLSTGSLFLIQTNLSDFFESAFRIEFIVKDYDSVGENDVLGSVFVNKKELLAGDGERTEYQLGTKQCDRSDVKVGNKKSFLALRFRMATKDDIQFMKSYESKKNSGVLRKMGLATKLTGVYTDDCYLPPRHHRSKTLKRQQRKAEDGMSTQYRLKPFADPLRPEAETKWLTHKEIERETQKPSRDWIEAGSGRVGKFYMEVLGCDDLPNLDLSVTGRDKSDPFVCIAFEDCVVNTDIINDCLSPRWMPWSRRAFVFNVMHPSSQLYISVMDYDEIIPGNPRRSHDKLGRCILNPTNVRPNTMYTFRMSLFTSDELDRKVTGKITFRFRYESFNERELLMSIFQGRNHYDVSTNRKTDFTTTMYAVTHDYDCYSLSLNTIQKYVDELIEYLDLLDDILDAMKTVILWRGHFPFKFTCFQRSVTVKLPFHSMIAFGWGILLSNDFDRIFSFMCFWIAWVLFATLERRRDNPNPWKRPRTYLELIGILLFNKSFARQTIAENENIEEIMEFDDHRADIVKFRKDAIEAMRLRNEFDSKQLEKESKEVDKQAHDSSASMSIGYNQIILAPFRDILEPVQIILYKAVIVMRVTSSIVMWNDSVAAFWIATIALVMSALVFYIPWAFFFQWTFTIFVWVFLGPWMKLVDVFFVEKVDSMNYQERKAWIEAEYKRRYDYILGESKIQRLIKEHQMKLRDMERYMFGQYTARVPIFKEERFSSIPLAGGSAVPYDSSASPPINIVRRINGQVLNGDMIPKRENPARKFNAAHKMGSLEYTPKSPSSPLRIPRLRRIDTGNEEVVPLLEEPEPTDKDDADTDGLLKVIDTASSYGTMDDNKTEREEQVMKDLSFDRIV